jgi:hypothetical protein
MPSCTSFTYHFDALKDSEKGGEMKETAELPEGLLESLPWTVAISLIGDHRVEANMMTAWEAEPARRTTILMIIAIKMETKRTPWKNLSGVNTSGVRAFRRKSRGCLYQKGNAARDAGCHERRVSGRYSSSITSTGIRSRKSQRNYASPSSL